MPHQREGIPWFLERPRAVLADVTGSGKTEQVMAVIGALRDRGPLERVLWVTELQVFKNTADRAARYLPGLSVVTSAEPRIADNTDAQQAQLLEEFGDPSGIVGPNLVITSYSMLHRRIASYSAVPWDLVVFDEASNIKGGGDLYNSASAVAASAGRVIAITATPSENALRDVWNLLAVAGVPDLPAEWTFLNRYAEWTEPEYENGRLTRQPKQIRLLADRLPELHGYLAQHMRRKNEADIKLPIPRLVESVRAVPLSLDQASYYKWVEMTDFPPKVAHAKLKQACAYWRGSSSKAEAARDLLLTRSGKAVVFAEHKKHLDIMEGMLTRAGIRWVRIDGEMKQDARATAIRTFREDPAVRVLTGTRAMERGVDGLQVAPLLISLGSADNPERERQRSGRIQRVGSEHATVEHITLISDTEFERRQWANVMRKRVDNDSVMAFAGTGASDDGWTDEELDELFEASQK